MDILYCKKDATDMLHAQKLEQFCSAVGCALRHLAVDEILAVFDDFSRHILNDAALYQKYKNAGLPFIAEFCSRSRLAALLDQALGNRHVLDTFLPASSVGQVLAARPAGLAVHWVAGNVPTLALLSLLLALLTKNVCVVRLPSAANDLVPDLIRLLGRLGETHKTVAEAVCLLKYEKEETGMANALSAAADARIIWGASATCAAIKQLPSKLRCVDSIFSDRVSCAFVGQQSLQEGCVAGVAAKLARDIHVFAQKACASPHTVFVNAAPEQRKHFAGVLYAALMELEARSPSPPPSPEETGGILKVRTRYAMLEDVLCSEGTQVTLLLDDVPAFGTPIGNQVVYVRPLPDLPTLLQQLPENILSIGIDEDSTFDYNFLLALADKGVQRFAPLGGMTRFEQPWDGIQLVQRLVRWVSAPTRAGAEA